MTRGGELSAFQWRESAASHDRCEAPIRRPPTLSRARRLRVRELRGRVPTARLVVPEHGTTFSNRGLLVLAPRQRSERARGSGANRAPPTARLQRSLRLRGGAQDMRAARRSSAAESPPERGSLARLVSTLALLALLLAAGMT